MVVCCSHSGFPALAGLSQGYLYLSAHWLSKAHISTIEATKSVLVVFLMASSLVTFVVRAKDEVVVPIVVFCGDGFVAGAVGVRAVVVRVLVGGVDVVVRSHAGAISFCLTSSAKPRSGQSGRLLLHDPLGLTVAGSATLFALVLWIYSMGSSLKITTFTTILVGIWSTESTHSSVDHDWAMET